MQFLLTAFDGTDTGAVARRMRARPAHVALGDEMVAARTMLFGTAILDDDGTMIGSMLVLDLPSRADVDSWLEIEPYVTGKVWERIDVRPCQVGPSFQRDAENG